MKWLIIEVPSAVTDKVVATITAMVVLPKRVTSNVIIGLSCQSILLS